MPISDEYGVVFIHIPKNAGSSIEEALAIPKHSPEKALLSTSYHPNHVYALQHLPYAALRGGGGSRGGGAVPRDKWRRYVKVAVVRNPWDRLVSDWHWRRRGGLPLGDLPFPAFVRTACAAAHEASATLGLLGQSQAAVSSSATAAAATAAGEAAGGGPWDEWRRRFAREYRGHFTPQVAFLPPERAEEREGGGEEERKGPSEEDSVHVLRFETLSRDWRAFCASHLKGGRELPLPVTNDSGRPPSAHYSTAYDPIETGPALGHAVEGRETGGDGAVKAAEGACGGDALLLVALVADAYAADVARFGYAFERPRRGKRSGLPVSARGSSGGSGGGSGFKSLLGKFKAKKKKKSPSAVCMAQERPPPQPSGGGSGGGTGGGGSSGSSGPKASGEVVGVGARKPTKPTKPLAAEAAAEAAAGQEERGEEGGRPRKRARSPEARTDWPTNAERARSPSRGGPR